VVGGGLYTKLGLNEGDIHCLDRLTDESVDSPVSGGDKSRPLVLLRGWEEISAEAAGLASSQSTLT